MEGSGPNGGATYTCLVPSTISCAARGSAAPPYAKLYLLKVGPLGVLPAAARIAAPPGDEVVVPRPVVRVVHEVLEEHHVGVAPVHPLELGDEQAAVHPPGGAVHDVVVVGGQRLDVPVRGEVAEAHAHLDAPQYGHEEQDDEDRRHDFVLVVLLPHLDLLDLRQLRVLGLFAVDDLPQVRVQVPRARHAVLPHDALERVQPFVRLVVAADVPHQLECAPPRPLAILLLVGDVCSY
eukprot:CAMPEP_0118931626 /NCGR_PEP_ID=MMETSP1169-20130426/7902_1 /TAXON_ID=36882 /ORGANISM="Pyramimonas obovata, Strain CCMP722" /LENGTH=235 /DNA_ID=CAMNT_0006874147 /DNA_START=287 /DNA_END=992 /DNA_ORIENTATION=-